MSTWPPRSARVGALRAAATLACCALMAGCVQMPTSGPVVEPQVSTGSDDAPGISFDPRPPQEGETAPEIVAGFLEAMKATPIKTRVARQFLSREAAEAWVPEKQILTYAELGTSSGETSVRVPLSDVNIYDERGAWQRSQAGSQLALSLVEEDGEWRIDEVPDALIVPDSWFDDWYQRVSLYYFDPTAEVLVPEPVFAPKGDTFASSLVRGLLALPPDGSPDVLRTYFPPDAAPGLSVPIEAGIAEVTLSGDPDAIDDDTAERMLAQLAATLRQEPTVRAVQLTIGDRTITTAGGSPQVTFEVASGYDPNSALSSGDLFALDRGRVVSGSLGAFEETLGPLGQPGYALRTIGVNISGSRVAAVSRTGSDLFLAPTEAPGGEVTTVVDGAVDLDPPHWDYRDRIWVLDRGAGRARVILVVDGSDRVVDVPGLSGRTVTELLVSRDGSRLVAVVRGTKADRVVSARILHDEAGTVVGFTPLQTLPLSPEGSPRIRDIGWRSPTTVSLLTVTDDISEVRTLSADGAPGVIVTGGTTRLRGPNRQLVSTPVELTDVYALAGRAVTRLTRPGPALPDLPKGLTSLTYAG
jgi:hypothetical protein